MKHGPANKVKEVWKQAGIQMSSKLSKTSGRWWFSTSEDDIAWLSIRIDPFPKLYSYIPYMSFKSPSDI